MGKVWVIVETTGEYSNESSIPVLAFLDSEKAQARMAQLDAIEIRVNGYRERMVSPVEWRDHVVSDYRALGVEVQIDPTNHDDEFDPRWELHEVDLVE